MKQIILTEKMVTEAVKKGSMASNPDRMLYTNYVAMGLSPQLEVVPSDLKYHKVQFVSDEFSFKCKLIKQPDYGEILLEVVPDDSIVEMRAFRDYLVSFREKDIYQEEAAFTIFLDYVHACKPLAAVMEMRFKARGGMATNVFLKYAKTERHAYLCE